MTSPKDTDDELRAENAYLREKCEIVRELLLRIYKVEAVESLADNDRHLAGLNAVFRELDRMHD